MVKNSLDASDITVDKLRQIDAAWPFTLQVKQFQFFAGQVSCSHVGPQKLHGIMGDCILKCFPHDLSQSDL